MKSGQRTQLGAKAFSIAAYFLFLGMNALGNDTPSRPANNTLEVLIRSAQFIQECQWPNGNITFYPLPPEQAMPQGFVDHPALMAINLARCYLYTGDASYLESIRKTIEFLNRAEPYHSQYMSGKCGEEQFYGMDAWGCWAQSFSIPTAWYYMLTGDKAFLEKQYPIVADAYDTLVENFPYMVGGYNHERLLYWKGIVLAKIMMDMAGQEARSEKYMHFIRVRREAFNYAWYEYPGIYSHWPAIEYDRERNRYDLQAYVLPTCFREQPKFDPFWAYWEYCYSSSPDIYLDSWLIDETLHARILKAARTVDAYLPVLPNWQNYAEYGKRDTVGYWVTWFLLRFFNEALLPEKGNQIYGSFFNTVGWPPESIPNYECSNTQPMIDSSHYGVFLTPRFRYPVEANTRLSDVAVLGEFASNWPERSTLDALPGAFYDAGIPYYDCVFYSDVSHKQMRAFFESDSLDHYRVLFISNRYAGEELNAYAPQLMQWVEAGGSLILLNTGTDDAGYPWLPEAIRVGQKAGYHPVSVASVEAGAESSPLLNTPNVLSQAALTEWGGKAGSGLTEVGSDWEILMRNTGDRAPVLIHRKYGQGWICICTLDAAGNTNPWPPLIANLYAEARRISGHLDSGSPNRADFEYPSELPVIPHIERMVFTDAKNNEIDYPFASNRTEPFEGDYQLNLSLRAPIAGSSASLVLPIAESYSISVARDGQPCRVQEMNLPGQRVVALEVLVDTTAEIKAEYRDNRTAGGWLTR